MKQWAEKWLQYSKILVVVTGIIFICTLVFCLTRETNSYYDTTIYAACITAAAGVFGSALIWYEKKSQAENVSKIKIQHVKDIAEIEIANYEKKLELKKKYGVLNRPEDDGEGGYLHNQLVEAITEDDTFLDGKMDDATAEPEMQSY